MLWLAVAALVVIFVIAGRWAGRPVERTAHQWKERGRHE